MNSPAIRFAGFTDDWEQRKLGDFVNITTGKLDANAMTEDGEFDFYTSGIKKYRIDVAAFEGPAITIAGNGATVGYMHLADGKFNAYQRTYVLTAFQADRQFLFSEIGNRLPQKITEEARAGNIPYIVMDMLTGLNIAVPSNSNEQKNIAAIFSCLDRLITLHQREHDKTVNIKKALLEKMFPKDGEDKPEIRFAGFTDAWEQWKLGELVEFFSGLTYSPHNVVSDGTLVLRSSNVKEGAIINADNVFVEAECVNVSNVQVGDIVVVVRNGSRNLIGKHALIKRSMPNTVIGAFMTGLRCHIPEFTNALLDTHHFDNEIKKNLGATINQITTGEFKKMTFFVPEQSEQKKIGRIFTLLDNLIALHQCELTKLQNIKKALLEKMFV